ncbi:putative HTH-type transcriptional regulator YerO [Sporosarcina sp. NCCP-2716]|uniref:TetR/AcrR family transcriptional regulator n=1 Tax=Sporosarcina sp. NCCP-2716 TaxID=2943679 RepID=UPI002041465E|nr:TetR/AcrR family transcriptional regulator [Sporosarcina sp. NCCP-2716]GKV68906.1 putative HTH-type transcriptional regulator YerO [Sporosarcina sp. NCCP-2716]
MKREEEIIQTAIDLFVEKGFAATSMQEVAERCSMSKATLYNFFRSKDELLVRATAYSYEQTMAEIDQVDLDSSLSAEERLIRKIVIQFDLIVSNKTFVLLLIRKLDYGSNQEVAELANTIYISMLNWFRKSLLDVFGPGAEASIWDCTFIMLGMIKEFLVLAIRGVPIGDAETVARFIVSRIRVLMMNPDEVQPLLTTGDLASFTIFDEEPAPLRPADQVRLLLADLEKALVRLAMPAAEQDEALFAVHALRDEFREGKPRPYMVKALLLYLEQFKKCEPLTGQIRQLAEVLYT